MAEDVGAFEQAPQELEIEPTWNLAWSLRRSFDDVEVC